MAARMIVRIIAGTEEGGSPIVCVKLTCKSI